MCIQGVNAIRKYYFDLKVIAGTNQRLIPVTVIGKTKAGIGVAEGGFWGF